MAPERLPGFIHFFQHFASKIRRGTIEILANSVAGLPARKIPKSMALVTLEFSDSAPILNTEEKQLPQGWHHYPYPAQLSQITEQWLKDGTHWVMRVPSAQSPTEHNYLFNPLHPWHEKLNTVKVQEAYFDPRLKR